VEEIRLVSSVNERSRTPNLRAIEIIFKSWTRILELRGNAQTTGMILHLWFAWKLARPACGCEAARLRVSDRLRILAKASSMLSNMTDREQVWFQPVSILAERLLTEPSAGYFCWSSDR